HRCLSYHKQSHFSILKKQSMCQVLLARVFRTRSATLFICTSKNSNLKYLYIKMKKAKSIRDGQVADQPPGSGRMSRFERNAPFACAVRRKHWIFQESGESENADGSPLFSGTSAILD